MIQYCNYRERVNILHEYIIFNYNLPLSRWCWLLKTIEFKDVISRYSNPILIYQGGQRIVFKVTDPRLGNVALKIGCYRTAQNPDGWDIERIEQEIDILRKLDSGYFPKNFHFEKISNDRYVILEEFVESKPLPQCMENFQNPRDILILIKHLVTGLEIIWNKNIVHRDLKPDNILIPQNKVPKIIDLGIARILDRSYNNSIFSSWAMYAILCCA